MNTEKEVDRIFADTVCNAVAWFNRSRALLGAARASKERADIVIDHWERHELYTVCYMLYGLSLENLFKAIWIYNKYGSPHDPDWLPEAKFPKEIKTHDLCKLAEMIDSSLVETNKLTLDLLSEAAIWSGRYPCSIGGKEGGKLFLTGTMDKAEEIYSKYSRVFTIAG
jgi:hypothetical protein